VVTVSSDVTIQSVVRSEWLKFRSVRSSIMGVVVTFTLTLGIGALVTIALRSHWPHESPLDRLTFDPVSTSLVGVLFAQFAVGVVGVLFITSEYSSGSIRTTLSAVPRRGQLVAGKLVVLIAAMFVVAEVASFATFLLGQAIFSGVVPTASLANASVVRAVILAGVYLTLLSVLGFSLGLLLRQSAACISLFTSLLLIIPIIVIFLPQSWQNDIARFEPSQLGSAMTSITTPAHDFGAWASLATLTIYVAVVTVAGVVWLCRRDA